MSVLVGDCGVVQLIRQLPSYNDSRALWLDNLKGPAWWCFAGVSTWPVRVHSTISSIDPSTTPGWTH